MRDDICSSSTLEMPDCYHFHSNRTTIARRRVASYRRFSDVRDAQRWKPKLDRYRYDNDPTLAAVTGLRHSEISDLNARIRRRSAESRRDREIE
jgi:hypothetical protein